ncbi:MAG TPA: bifunctional protein-serine/threonine kinase/phosphatase [Gammaproteobacteria bacterium]|nr:bifunctional protein-serine/threonine kinase/phosphatase [Gammaproteobacteria bacterium]
MPKTPSIQVASACHSIAGVKPQNEDACGVQVPDEPLLTTKGLAAVVADGMSGADAGRQASRACVQGFLSDYFSTPESWSVKTSGQKILTALNHWLYGNGQREYGSHKGMVTTVSALVLKSNTAHLFHVGDTRIYRLRDDELEQLTTDHRIDMGEDKTYLSRAMGIDIHLEIDYRTVTVEAGDVFVLLTDGVHEFLPDSAIRRTIREHRDDPETAARRLVEQAEANRSNDNLTALVLRVDRLPQENETEFYQKLTELPFPPPLEPGMVLDGYRILRHLFANKRTEVYLVQDTESGEKLVLKAPSVNYEDDPEYIHQFLHEEWVGRRINNPHVMKVVESPRKRTALYYLAEHIEGRTLRQWMDDEPRPSLNTVRDMIEQIARGLRAFHRLEMIHQDLKPENILVDEHGTLKIIDFGSTKIAGIEEIYVPLDTNNLLGTINYTAPEYHIGQPPSNRSDIFSLGVIAYELLTGRLPYGKDLTARNLRRVRYQPIKRFNPEIPIWVDRAIEKAVNINPENRFGKLSEFTHALRHPDPRLAGTEHVPLLERHPVRVWQTISALLLILNIWLLWLLSR